MTEPWGWHECQDEKGRWWVHWCGMFIIEIQGMGSAVLFAVVNGNCEGEAAENLDKVKYFGSHEAAKRWVSGLLREGMEEWRTAIGRAVAEDLDRITLVLFELNRKEKGPCSPEPS